MSSSAKVFGGSKTMAARSCNDALWLPNGGKSMLSFENDAKTELSFFQTPGGEEEIDNDAENDDELIQPSCKKRRLSTNQVQFLEKSFEVENKLEPERKVELAKELGLQPRQVAIWFQNRRARYKIKQLEKDYDALRASYDSLKSEYDDLLKENDNLKFEVNSLKEKLSTKENEKGLCLEPENTISKSGTEAFADTNVPILVCKQEDASSAKSDIFDSSDDSPHYAENNYCSFLEPTEQSDGFSQDDDDNLILRKNFFAPSSFLPKLEACYYDDPTPTTSSCHLDFAAGEDQTFNFWPY